MAHAGAPVDDRHEEQEGEYGTLPRYGVGMGREVGAGLGNRQHGDADDGGMDGDNAQATEFTAERTLLTIFNEMNGWKEGGRDWE